MANIIKIKRAPVGGSAQPTSLVEGELAYSEQSKNLFIGTNGGADLQIVGGKTDHDKLALIEPSATADQTDEEIQDIVGGMVSGNTESGLAVTYDDASGKLNFNVNDPTVTLTGAVTGAATMTNLGSISITTTATNDPTITLIGAVTGEATMTNLGNVSITTTATNDPTLTLTGDASGNATFTNLGDASLTVSISDATTSAHGMMSSADETKHNTIASWYDLMIANNDGDSIINTVHEIIDAFSSDVETSGGFYSASYLAAPSNMTLDGGTF